MSNKTKNRNLNYLIDPTFTNVFINFFYHFKMKMTVPLFQDIMYQVLILQTSMH